MYQTKTDWKVRYVPQSDEEVKTFRHQREHPLQVGVGLLAHQQMRSKSVINVLHELGVSVNYVRILRIETQLAQAVLSNSSEQNIFIPPKLCKGQLIFFSVDNSDFSEDTQKITAVVMGENHKTVITFDLQLYEKAVKLQLHKAPDLDHLVF